MAFGNSLRPLEFPFESRIVHEHFDLLVHRRLIPFERDDVTGAALHDFADDLLLAARRVDRDDRAFEIQQLQQIGDRGDFIGFFIRLDLSDDELRPA